MNSTKVRQTKSSLSKIISSVLLMGIMAACTPPTQLATTPQPTELPAATAMPSPTLPTPATSPTLASVATRSADETRIAEYQVRVRTQVALTPTEPLPTLGPWPTPTRELGSVPCAGGNILDPELYSCWRGIVNGEIVSVGAGRESNESGDPNQGLVAVFEGPLFDFSAATTQVYTTPARIGGVRIVAIAGTRFLLSPVDLRTPGALGTPWATSTPGTLLVFDLATRQWVNP